MATAKRLVWRLEEYFPRLADDYRPVNRFKLADIQSSRPYTEHSLLNKLAGETTSLIETTLSGQDTQRSEISDLRHDGTQTIFVVFDRHPCWRGAACGVQPAITAR